MWGIWQRFDGCHRAVFPIHDQPRVKRHRWYHRAGQDHIIRTNIPVCVPGDCDAIGCDDFSKPGCIIGCRIGQTAKTNSMCVTGQHHWAKLILDAAQLLRITQRVHHDRDVAGCMHIELKVSELTRSVRAECGIDAVDVIAGVIEKKICQSGKFDDFIDAA